MLRLTGVGAVAGSLAALEACGGSPGPRGYGANENAASADADVLNSSLDLEHMAVAAYTVVIPRLSSSRRSLGHRFLTQERAHATALSRLIGELGGTPNQPRASYDFLALHDESGALRFANDIENTAVAAYIDALPKLSNPILKATVASIITNEAEHLSVLASALHQTPAPTPFVVGRA